MGYREPEERPYDVAAHDLGQLSAIGISLAWGGASVALFISIGLWLAGSPNDDWPLRTLSSFLEPSDRAADTFFRIGLVVIAINMIGALYIRGLRLAFDRFREWRTARTGSAKQP